MGSLKWLHIRNYRSVRDEVHIRIPERKPLVLVGANNAGKSNIARALDLVLGETWPGNHDPSDHEFHGRDKTHTPMVIKADVDGISHVRYDSVEQVASLHWSHNDGQTKFEMLLASGIKRYVNNDVRAQCVCVYMGADRRLSYQLSYVSRFTFLSKLMRRFHDELTADANRTSRLKDTFSNVKTIFEEVEPFTQFRERLAAQLEEFSGGLNYRLQVDFSAYDPSNYFHALRVMPLEGDSVRTFEELGTGQEQLLAFSFVQAYAEAFHDEGGLVLLVEEPESHLHPLAQQWLAQKMSTLAESGVQVVITTHSPAFVNLLNLEGLVLVQRQDGTTTVTQRTAQQVAEFCRQHNGGRSTAENVLPFYAAHATPQTLEGFFAQRILLVEGASERLALPIYWRRLGLDAVRDGIAVIDVGGVGDLAKWWRLYGAYGLPVYPLFDNDRPDEDDADGSRRNDLLSTLNVLPEDVAALLHTRTLLVTPRLAAFGEEFEEAMRDSFGTAYTELEAEAAEAAGLRNRSSKPLVARYVAERLDLDASPEMSQRLRDLHAAVLAVTAPEF